MLEQPPRDTQIRQCSSPASQHRVTALTIDALPPEHPYARAARKVQRAQAIRNKARDSGSLSSPQRPKEEALAPVVHKAVTFDAHLMHKAVTCGPPRQELPGESKGSGKQPAVPAATPPKQALNQKSGAGNSVLQANKRGAGEVAPRVPHEDTGDKPPPRTPRAETVQKKQHPVHSAPQTPAPARASTQPAWPQGRVSPASAPLTPNGHPARNMLADLVEGYLLHCRIQKSPKTVLWYEQKLGVFITWLALQDITTPQAVRASHLPIFLDTLRTRIVGDAGSALQRSRKGPPRPFSDLTIRGYAQVVKGFFTWCVKMEDLPTNPFHRVPLPRVRAYLIQTFSEEHIRGLLKATEQCRAPVRDRALLWTLLDTGLRVSELCGLTIADVKLKYTKLLVHGKGNKDREVAISDSLKKTLWKYSQRYRLDAADDEPFFVGHYGHKLRPNGVTQWIHRLGKLAEIKGVRCSAHTCRHTFAVNFLQESGGDIKRLQLILGHEDLATVEEYLKTLTSHAALDQHRRFSPMDAYARRHTSRR